MFGTLVKLPALLTGGLRGLIPMKKLEGISYRQLRALKAKAKKVGLGKNTRAFERKVKRLARRLPRASPATRSPT